MDKIEPYAYNALCCPASDATTVRLYQQFCSRVRDEVGSKFQLVAWQPSTADYEGIIGVWNTVTPPHHCQCAHPLPGVLGGRC